MYMYSVFHFYVPARARRENGHDSPSSRSTVQKRPFSEEGLGKIGPDSIGWICGIWTDQIRLDLIVASSSGAVPRPDRKGGGQRTSCQEARVAC